MKTLRELLKKITYKDVRWEGDELIADVRKYQKTPDDWCLDTAIGASQDLRDGGGRA